MLVLLRRCCVYFLAHYNQLFIFTATAHPSLCAKLGNGQKHAQIIQVWNVRCHSCLQQRSCATTLGHCDCPLSVNCPDVSFQRILHCLPEYAQVLKMLGNGRLEAMCFDGTKRLCHIRGKLRKKVGTSRSPRHTHTKHSTRRKTPPDVTLSLRFLSGQSATDNVAAWTQLPLCVSECNPLFFSVFLQVWINNTDIILVGLRDYQVRWLIPRDTDPIWFHGLVPLLMDNSRLVLWS